MDSTGPGGHVTRSPRSQHGDVDIHGDLVDELRPSHSLRLMDRERRLAAAITADSDELARAQLANVLRALDGVPA